MPLDHYVTLGRSGLRVSPFEAILGDYFAARPGRRSHVVLASKFFGNMFPGDPNGGGAGRGSILAQLHETLRRLRTDYLDVYWLHNWDRNTPVEETMRTLDDLVGTAGSGTSVSPTCRPGSPPRPRPWPSCAAGLR
jgi:hypothetical protein